MSRRRTQHGAALGLDVGKGSRWACLVTKEGEVALNRRVANSEGGFDELFAQVELGTLVVVDQVRNIGALAIRGADSASTSPTSRTTTT